MKFASQLIFRVLVIGDRYDLGDEVISPMLAELSGAQVESAVREVQQETVQVEVSQFCEDSRL